MPTPSTRAWVLVAVLLAGCATQPAALQMRLVPEADRISDAKIVQARAECLRAVDGARLARNASAAPDIAERIRAATGWCGCFYDMSKLYWSRDSFEATEASSRLKEPRDFLRDIAGTPGEPIVNYCTSQFHRS